jgi:type VI secretion system secreted protein Hcp
MKNIPNKTLLLTCLAATAVYIVFVMSASGGSLEPASPPAPTMHSLEEIYNMAGSIGMPVWPLAPAKSTSLAYVSMTGMLGESNEPAHNNWIEALSVSYMISQAAESTSSSATGGKGDTTKGGSAKSGTKVSFTDLYFVKEIDRSSPKLATSCASGKAIPNVVIEFTRMYGATRRTYFKVTLTDVVVRSVMPVMSPRTNDDFTHLEQISIRGGKIEWQYNRYDNSGNLLDSTTERWDVKASRAY